MNSLLINENNQNNTHIRMWQYIYLIVLYKKYGHQVAMIKLCVDYSGKLYIYI